MEIPRTQQGPVRQIAALWFAAGVAVASFVTYFFDNQQGSARRHMACDKVMSTGRRIGGWSGKKSRHLRNKASGVMAEIKTRDESESVATGR
ncbi:MAG TPA: hypothetical protein VFK22_03365 [Candidatus Dormibacteraeota bacterium]|nr:hypothetical protein [Candidatus Dormibacteraeota bacterium]